MFLQRLFELFARIPNDAIALLARLGIGTVFLRSGMLKLDGWSNGNTIFLFQNEYHLPLIPPELAAPVATAMELSMPMFLFAGLGTRFAALALLGMTLVIEIFIYPNAFDTHAVWTVSLLFLIKHGAGIFSLDHWLRKIAGMPQRADVMR